MATTAIEQVLPQNLQQDYYFPEPEDKAYRQCTTCVMDTTASEIVFDESGCCTFCRGAKERVESIQRRRNHRELDTAPLFEEMRARGKRRRYDCVVGLSGGLDSSYVAYLLKQEGLRLLAVHFDNGWNSELAVKNIELLVERLGIDLYTHVVEWDEFRDMQRSLFKASVVDIEILTDHANLACAYHQARKWRTNYIIRGKNTATESIMPSSWQYRKRDVKNIRAIHQQFGTTKPNTFPWMGYMQRQWMHSFWGIRHVWLLDYLDFDKAGAGQILVDELDWKPYAHKHGESTFTWFFQNYVLPRKFGFDKRRPHLSALIVSGQLNRKEALAMLEEPLVKGDELHVAYEYVTRKLGFTVDEFETYLNSPLRSHRDYPSELPFYFKYRRLVSGIGKLARIPLKPFIG